LYTSAVGHEIRIKGRFGIPSQPGYPIPVLPNQIRESANHQPRLPADRVSLSRWNPSCIASGRIAHPARALAAHENVKAKKHLGLRGFPIFSSDLPNLVEDKPLARKSRANGNENGRTADKLYVKHSCGETTAYLVVWCMIK
jgi:hypothetical protein